MKRLTLLLFMCSFFLGYSQETPPSTQAQDWNSSRSNKTSKTSSITNPDGNNPPPSTQAQDWNSSRSNKTSKTSSIANPDGNNNSDKAIKNIHQLGMIIERLPSNSPNYYVNMSNKELTIFNKLSNQEKKLYFSDYISKTIKRINPEEKIDKENIMQATLSKWCGPCPLISAKTVGGIIEITKKDFVYKIYFSKGGRKDVEKVVIADIIQESNNPSFAISPEDEDGGSGGFCYRPLSLNIDTTLEPMPIVEEEFCMDDSATQRVGNNKNDKTKYFFTKRSIKNNNETQSKDGRKTPFHNKYRPMFRQANPNNGKDIRKNITIGLSSGISAPSSTFKNNGFVSNGSFIKFDGAYYFSKFGIGLSVGQISSKTNNNFSSSINSADIATTNTTQNWKQFYYEVGPEYKTQFGNFSATFSTKIGLQSVKSVNLESNYNNGETPIAIIKIKSAKNSSLSYFSTDLKFGYNLSSNLSLFAIANYMSAFSNGIAISESKITDTNKNGIIDAEDLKIATGSATIDYQTSTKNIKPQSTNFGIGISYTFSSKRGYDYSHRLTRSTKYRTGDTNDNTQYIRKRPGRTKYSNITLKSKGTSENSTIQKGRRRAKRECLEAGGVFSESSNGSYFCYKQLSLSRTASDSGSDNELYRNGKRKCWKAGGKWMTNSHGSWCSYPSAASKIDNNSSESPEIVKNKVKEVIKKKEAVKNSINPQDDDNSQSPEGFTKESTIIFVKMDETSLRKSNTKIPEDKLIQENDKRMSKRALRNRKRYRERAKDRALRSADKRYRERAKDKALRSTDKRYRERTKDRALRSTDKRYRERAKDRALRSTDKRYRERAKDRALRFTDKRYRERAKDRALRSADKRYRERAKDRALRSTDKRYRERAKDRALRSTDKRYRERAKDRALRSADKRYRERAKDRVLRSVDKRYRENTIQNDKPIQITTKETNIVNPSTNLDARFLKAQNGQTIQLVKSRYQLTAPLLNSAKESDIINYNWAIINKTQNKVVNFTGKTINYTFDESGNYEIEITPIVNHKNLNSYRTTIICK